MPIDFGAHLAPPGLSPESQAQIDAEQEQRNAQIDLDTASREQIIGVTAPTSDMSVFDASTMVRAAIGMHLSQQVSDMDWTYVIDPLADKFLEMFGRDPAMIGAVQNDLTALLALTDDEIAQKISRGEPLQPQMDLVDAITEVAWTIGADDLAAMLGAEEADSIKGTFDALSKQEALDAVTPDMVNVTPATRYSPDMTASQEVQDLFDVPGSWSYSRRNNTLSVTVGEQTITTSPGRGFDPNTTLDVVAEVVAAKAEGRVLGGDLTGGQAAGAIERITAAAHKVGKWVDANPVVQQSIDRIWNDATRFSVYNLVENLQGRGTPIVPEGEDPGPVARGAASLKNEKDQITAEAIKQASLIPLPDDAIIATLAGRFMDWGGGELTNKEALDLAAEAVDEDRDNWLDSVRQLTQEELVSEMESDLEDKSGLGTALETVQRTALQVMEGYDRFVQSIGVFVVDAIADQMGGEWALLKGDFDEGFKKFGDMFAEVPDVDTVADYFGLEGGWYDTVNIASSIVFDPINWATVGGKGAALIAQKALTNPKFAGIYLRMGRFPGMAKQIAEAGRGLEVGVAEGLAGDVAEGQAAISFVGRPVTASQQKAVRVVAGMAGAGMDTDDMVDLVRIALDPDGTVDQVNEVWKRALSKDWLPDSTMGPTRHQTIEGLGAMLESAAGGKLSEEHLDTVIKLFAKLSAGRSFRIGENQGLQGIVDLLTQFFPADRDAFTRNFLRVVEAVDEAGSGYALKGARALTKEQARRATMEAGGTLKAIQQGDDILQINRNLRDVESALANLGKTAAAEGWDDTATDWVRRQLVSTHDTMSARVEAAKPGVMRTKEKARTAHKELVKAARLDADVTANPVRDVIEYQAHVIYEEMAQRLNAKFGDDVIPIMKGHVNPAAPNIPVRDWSAVTGQRKTIAGDDPDLGILLGLAGDDPALASQLRGAGMVNRSQHMLLPASPYEVILFEKLGGPGKAMEGALRAMNRQWAKNLARGFKVIFAANLLMNPLSAGRITFDETLRFLAETGNVGRFLESTIGGTPGIGEPFLKLVRRIRNNRYGEAISSPWAMQYRRNVAGWSADDYADYGWVERPARRGGAMTRSQYREQVERWLNGTLIQDRRFQAYARWLDDAVVTGDGTLIPPDEFTKWWEEGEGVTRPGKADTKPVTLTIRDQTMLGTELSATDVFNILDNAFNRYIDNFVDTNQRKALKDAMLRAARTPQGRVTEAHLLNAVQQVPGLSPNTGFGSGAFQLFFGGPSGRRSGVFFEHYFDEGYNILMRRHGDRVLTVDALTDLTGWSKADAEIALRQGTENAVVSRLVSETGMRTEGQIAARAAAYAERKADDLIYRFTANSLIGRGVESGLVMPFARAQVDFISWWWDHLTKPMTFRLSPEVRAKLPGVAQDILQFAETVPINARALAKYSHVVAAVNNDEPSVIDQLITGFTFFPLRYDQNLLLDVGFQPGPIPTWIYDRMVDTGAIDDETIANLQTIFPALQWSESTGNPMYDFADKWLPNSRRSIRKFGLNQARALYSLFGKDIHTDSDILGIMSNMWAENKLPAATADFQTALFADLLAGGGPRRQGATNEAGVADYISRNPSIWDLKPGDEGFQQTLTELAIQGALEANKSEWAQDLKDKVWPLADYDAEYRSLRAYDALFTEGLFDQMVDYGLFETNDLLTNDEGVPRVRQAWDAYTEGTATREELAYLDDALTSAYFKAGELEYMPGFSYLDYLNLTAPELTVNLIAKNEDSGIPVRDTVARNVGSQKLTHAEFKQNYINAQNGRLINVPPGPEGSEIVKDARALGWLSSRPIDGPDGWAVDALEAVYKSGARATHGVWEWLSGRTWVAGLTQAISPKTFALPQAAVDVLTAAGMSGLVEGTVYTFGEFHEMLDDFDERFKVAQPTIINTLADGTVHSKLSMHDTTYGLGLIDAIHEAELGFNRAGIESIEDWPAETIQDVRDRFSVAIDLGYITLGEYNQEIKPLFGDLDYQPPVPPPVDDLETGFTVSGEDMADVQVIDGDTISVLLDDGPMRVRLIGINAPEATQPGYFEARDQLDQVIANAESITVGVFMPELFGLTQRSSATEQRILAWLYVDGVPLYDATVFSADNPRGAGVGGNVIDLQKLLEVRQ